MNRQFDLDGLAEPSGLHSEVPSPAADESKGASLRSNSVARLAADGSQLVFALVAATITARVLGPAGKGYYASLVLLAGLFAHIFNAGLGESTIVFAGRGRATMQLVASSTISAMTALAVVGGVALYAVGALVLEPTTSNERVALGLASVMLVFNLYGVVVSSLLVSQERVVPVGVLGVISAFVSTVALWPLLAVLHLGVAGAVTGSLLSAVFALLAMAVLLRRGALSLRPGWDGAYLGAALRFGAVVQVSNILVLMTGRLDLLLVYHLASPATAGTYSIALTIGALVASVPLALAYAAFPRLARLDEEESRALVSQLTRIGLAAALLTGAVLAIASPIAIPLVFGSAYRSALTPTLLLIPGGVLGAGQWLLTRSATARGVPRVVVLSYAVSLLVMLALDLALIPGSGAEGAAIAATVSQLAGMLVPLPYYVRRQWRISEFIPRPRDVVYLGASLRQMLVRSR